VTEPSSFENANKKWVPEIEKNVPSTPILIVGNKTD